MRVEACARIERKNNLAGSITACPTVRCLAAKAEEHFRALFLAAVSSGSNVDSGDSMPKAEDLLGGKRTWLVNGVDARVQMHTKDG